MCATQPQAKDTKKYSVVLMTMTVHYSHTSTLDEHTRRALEGVNTRNLEEASEPKGIVF